ncbi:MAG: undecaprenyl/decaprenyl-phosphate alpha-N-acetylglucosaminyl 1-phosphate transferase [Armatimonadetes bacterium]|nr:undecaprenyl/decaprenyl-phosphate alpha-N-acetylglucosaminyl 1-phosphate transferase [Armatimonadota bacterium]
MTGYVLALAVSLGVSLWLIPRILRWAVTRGLVDPSGGRKSHAVEVPRLGGVGIVAGLFAGVVAASLASRPSGWWSTDLVGMLVGALLVHTMGLTDDLLHDAESGREGLPPVVKLLWQFGAALVPVAASAWVRGGVLIRGFAVPAGGYVNLPGWLAWLVTLTWIVGVANAFNFLDGRDGLAGGVALIVTTAVAMIALSLPKPAAGAAVVALAMVGATLGFLRHNFPPARIYMGDGGAHLLGYLLAVLSVSSVAKSLNLFAVGVPLIVLGLPIVNLAQVVLGRVLRGDSPMQADATTQIHDRLRSGGWSDFSTVLFIYAVCGLCASAALSLSEMPRQSAALSGLVAALLVLVAARGPRVPVSEP